MDVKLNSQLLSHDTYRQSSKYKVSFYMSMLFEASYTFFPVLIFFFQWFIFAVGFMRAESGMNYESLKKLLLENC